MKKILTNRTIFLVFIVSFLLAAVFHAVFFQTSRARITVVIDAEIKSKMRFYWADETAAFTEGCSTGFHFEKGKGTYHTQIGDLSKIGVLRFDPAETEGAICIKRIRIAQPGFAPIDFKTRKDFAGFVPIHQIEHRVFTEKGFCVVSGGIDPHMQTPLSGRPSRFHLIKDAAVVFFSITGLAVIFAFFGLFGVWAVCRTAAVLPEAVHSQSRLFHVVFWTVLLVRTLFILTYPLNVSGDGKTYYLMLQEWKGNLALAGGYPFFFGPWTALFNAITVFHPDIFSDALARDYFLLIFQHAADFFAMVLVFLLLRHRFGGKAALAWMAIYGLNPFVLGNMSTTRPEWFQSALFQIGLATGYAGFRSDTIGGKIGFYMASALVFSLGFLSKYNLLPLGSVWFIILFLDPANRRLKLKISAAGVCCTILLVGGYLAAFHQPSTGTWALTHDKSWILIKKIRWFTKSPKLDKVDGVNVKRFKLLTYLLLRHGWPKFHAPTLYSRIDAVSPEIRNSFREKYGYILHADLATLERLFEKHPEARDFYWDQLIISYYMGLKESDRLGTRIFFEAIQSQPLAYLRNMLAGTAKSAVLFKPNNFPLNRNLGWSALSPPQGISFSEDDPEDLSWGFYRVPMRADRRIQYADPVCWRPGVDFFSVLSHPFYPLVPLAWFLFLVEVISSLRHRLKTGSYPEHFPVFLSVGLLTIGFIVWSSMIYRFRPDKELILTLPVLSFFCALGFARIIAFFKPNRERL
ncbi:MAG: hypothetical protein JRI76_07955 [Deltaproteobacteria bacterium]|nr:hypothetical protein [Deltaproteobacteria bacterium]